MIWWQRLLSTGRAVALGISMAACSGHPSGGLGVRVEDLEHLQGHDIPGHDAEPGGHPFRRPFAQLRRSTGWLVGWWHGAELAQPLGDLRHHRVLHLVGAGEPGLRVDLGGVESRPGQALVGQCDLRRAGHRPLRADQRHHHLSVSDSSGSLFLARLIVVVVVGRPAWPGPGCRGRDSRARTGCSCRRRRGSWSWSSSSARWSSSWARRPSARTVTVSWEPATRSETVCPLRVGSAT